ncbi:hypothetical protein NOR_03673 [Metarhizium rileyi]|uniref:Uncharacterized protein n=1 Tax=Metarhizium rileyi (strain RCEF 4871) TaxID=1649241 RepID=A0A167F8C2_METRR|nr:hypothetical protein NOR_03673 [Metarhizium rileyi RCEF 4871]
MGSGSSLSPSDTEEVVGGLLKQVVSYGEQSSPDATVNYETGCGSDSTVTGAYVSFPNFDNWSSTKPNHAFREADE